MQDTKNNISRRGFLHYLGVMGLSLTTHKFLGGALPVLGSGRTACSNPRMHFTLDELQIFNTRFNARGLPTRLLGDTGVVVPRMGLGLGSRFCNLAIKDEQQAIEMLHYALDNGFYYWDTAPAYTYTDKASNRTVYSEQVVGYVTKYRREEIFLNSKMCTRDPEEMERSMENTLRLLNTDRLDMIMIHAVQNTEDIEVIRRAKIIERLERMREQGLFRLLGFSCHDEAEAIHIMAGTGRFDTVLMALDPYRHSKSGPREEEVTLASSHGMGVMLMKAVRGYENRSGTDFNQTIRCALEFPGATGAMVGMDSKDIVDKNLALLRSL